MNKNINELLTNSLILDEAFYKGLAKRSMALGKYIRDNAEDADVEQLLEFVWPGIMSLVAVGADAPK